MHDALRFRVLTTAAVLSALVGGCVTPRTTCGESPDGRGPPVIATQDAELCESVRLRVADALGRMQGLYDQRAQDLRDLTWRWEDAATLDGFLRRVREDGGQEIAAAIARAVEDVRAHSTKPARAGCDDERCLVKGAALGARIAFDDAAAVLRTIRRAQGGSARDQELIEQAKNR